MLPTFSHIHLLYLGIAIILEVIANILMKKSNGFERKIPAAIAIACVFGAFTALSFAIEGIHLSVAYGIWGGIGLIATALLGITMFNERLHLTGWLGIIFVMLGVTLMRVA
jgi:spermidine export protein MdtI